jgi:hypothetical protein
VPGIPVSDALPQKCPIPRRVCQNLRLVALASDQSWSTSFPAGVILLHAFKLNLLNFCQALPLLGNEMIQFFM